MTMTKRKRASRRLRWLLVVLILATLLLVATIGSMREVEVGATPAPPCYQFNARQGARERQAQVIGCLEAAEGMGE